LLLRARDEVHREYDKTIAKIRKQRVYSGVLFRQKSRAKVADKSGNLQPTLSLTMPSHFM